MRMCICTFGHIVSMGQSVRAEVTIKAILDPGPTAPRFSSGDTVWTSAVKSVDFERGMLLTKNSLYLFEPQRVRGGG